MRTSEQQRDATGLIGRLRQVLGPAVAAARPSAEYCATRAESLPGLCIQVAPDGTILGVSAAFAETVGAVHPASLRGRPIAAYLPAVAPGGPLFEEIRTSGEIRDVPVHLLGMSEKTEFSALLSARVEAGNGMTPGAVAGCLTLPSAQAHRFSPPAAVDRELVDGMRVELRSQSELLPLQFPIGGEGDARDSARSLVRMYLVFLPRLEAILALHTPPARQVFDARDSLAELCQASGRLLDCAGVVFIFDTDPAFPRRVTADEDRVRTCLSLMLGAVSRRKIRERLWFVWRSRMRVGSTSKS